MSAWRALAVLALVLSGGSATVRAQQPFDPAQYVNPFIGTAPAESAQYGFEFDGGDVFPGATYPMGMLYWSPDTAEHSIPGGYYYPDQQIKGFSLTHFSGRGCTVYLDVPLMPMNGHAEQPQPATFKHASEIAQPGAYRVYLDTGIDVELTTTARSGLGTFTFPDQSESSIAIDLAGSVNGVFNSNATIDPDRQRITGQVTSQVGCGTDQYTLYFALEFDQPFLTYGQTGTTVLVTFAQHAVTVKPAISYVSVQGALNNLQAENPGWDLAAVRQQARAAWNDILGDVRVSGGTADQLTVFYTALYHAFLHPNVFNDADRSYIGFDDQVHQVEPGHAHYFNIPGWDQYRALIQLRAMLDPERTSDIVQSLVDDAQQGGGGMPRWQQANRNSNGMVGDSPGAYVASAYALGARNFDTAAALTALDLGGSTPGTQSGGHPVREYLADWLRLGYIPDQPSISLEYATDDYAIGQFAATLGDRATANRYLQRAQWWSRTFDMQRGLIAPRSASGTFPERLDPGSSCCGFVEGNAAQYTWMVPFDVPGLASRMGGREVAVARLDGFFSQLNAGPNSPYGWIGNEPGLSAPWAYNALGAPAKTQALVRRIQSELFTATPGGLPGNDDGGTLSAWYVLSALGLFPATPGLEELQIATPLFEDAVIDAGRRVHIVAHGEGPYVQSIRLNGQPYYRSSIAWSDLVDATLEFERSVDQAVLPERHQE